MQCPNLYLGYPYDLGADPRVQFQAVTGWNLVQIDLMTGVDFLLVGQKIGNRYHVRQVR